MGFSQPRQFHAHLASSQQTSSSLGGGTVLLHGSSSQPSFLVASQQQQQQPFSSRGGAMGTMGRGHAPLGSQPAPSFSQGHISAITGSAPTFSQQQNAMHGRPSTAPQPHAGIGAGAGALRQSLAPVSSQQTYAPMWGSQPQDDWCGGGGGGGAAVAAAMAPAPALPRSVAALRRSGSGGQLRAPGDGLGRPGSAPDARELAAAAAGRLTGGSAALGFQPHAPQGLGSGAQQRGSLLQDIETRPAPAGGPAAARALHQQQPCGAAVQAGPATAGLGDGAAGRGGELVRGVLLAAPGGAVLASLEGRLDSVHERCSAVQDGVAALREQLERQARSLDGVGGACADARAGVERLAAAVAGVGERIEVLLARQEAAAGGGGGSQRRRAAAAALDAACQTSPGALQGGAAHALHAGAAAPASGSHGCVARRSSSPSEGPPAAAAPPTQPPRAAPASQGPQASSGSGKPSQQSGTAAKKRAGGRTARLLQQAASMPGQQLLRFPSGASGAAAPAQAAPAPAAPATSQRQLMTPLGEPQRPRAAAPRGRRAPSATPEPCAPVSAAAAALVGLQTEPHPAAPPPPPAWAPARSSPPVFGGGSGDTGGSGRGSSSGDEDEDEGGEGDEERIAQQLAARVASHRSKRLRRALSDYC
ncbi:hypothetical protein Rsub_11021 [Raphidocelis subcapitata]|uniref:Uncharacterized protein n=1 Tax=Raphidocelis subcapitata TaxID=307507 RepID=A0A2V0PBZ9_9CHLO|nr:hypothetical protein Rsub_11021 [Raphidocelis subcapitata]|eukprot:GBF97374.1 hypothetical protein Rsub_11021 [Raphidocelis subcapitata]